MKFLHTADWQIGMNAHSVGKAGVRVREERLHAGKRVVQAAKDNGAEFILIAGDLFEDNAVDRVLVQKAADILSEFAGNVFLIPGNHDPLMPGSVWDHPAWKSTANVYVLCSEEPVELDGGFLYPCPIKEKHSGKNPTAWIDAEGKEGIHLGLAHGTVEGIHQEEPDYPIPRSAPDQKGLDYLALGHWHSLATYPTSDGIVRMAYSGTPETTRFGERDSGNALIVDIAKPGAAPVVTNVKTNCLTWQLFECDIREQGELAKIRKQIEFMENASNILLDVKISGLLVANDRGELERIEYILLSRFLMGRMEISALKPSPEDENWISGLPPGIIREAATKLRDSVGGEGVSPEVASRALIEMYAIIEEVTK